MVKKTSNNNSGHFTTTTSSESTAFSLTPRSSRKGSLDGEPTGAAAAAANRSNGSSSTLLKPALILLGACTLLATDAGVLKNLLVPIPNTQVGVERIQQNSREQIPQQQQPPLLPWCEDLMNRHDFLRDGAFLTRQSNQVAWIVRADDSRELTLPHVCRLKRYTVDEARQCLAHKHILTIGDSLTRYQILGFMYFLERGRHPARFLRRSKEQICTHLDEEGQPQCGGVDEKNVCSESEHFGWSKYHQYLGDKRGPYNGHLECACARALGYEDVSDTETLLYRNFNISVTHMTEQGFSINPAPIMGRNFQGCAESGSCTLSLDEIDASIERSKAGEWDWNITLMDPSKGGFSNLKKLLGKVDITLYNRGHWNQMTMAMAKDLMPQFSHFATERCFYKSTTGSMHLRGKPYLRPLAEADRIFADTKGNGCGYLDYAHVTSPFEHEWDSLKILYFDALHYQPWVYEELNNLLLNVLCNVKL